MFTKCSFTSVLSWKQLDPESTSQLALERQIALLYFCYKYAERSKLPPVKAKSV